MRLRWVAGGVLLLLIAGVAGVLVFANRLIDANRDRLLAAAEKAIGRPVHVGSIGARLFGRPAVRLTEVSIGDDPAFGGEPFISARGATVVLKLWPLLESRLEIARIELDRPLARLLRAEDGRFNYATLGPAAALPSSAEAEPGPSSPGAGLAWGIALFDIDDGGVDYIDRTQSPPRTTTAREIALRASDIALDEAMHFDLRAAVDGPSENVRLSGEVGPVASREGVPFDVTGALGPFARAPARLEQIVAKGRVRAQSIDLDTVSFDAFGGELSGQGTIALVDRGPFSFSGKGSGIEVHQLMPVIAPKAKQEIAGRASLSWDLQGVGRTEEALRQSLRGDADVDVRDGVLRNVNVVGEVVNRLTSLPGLTQFVSRGVKPKYAAVLNRPNTEFSSLVLRLRFIPGGVQVETLKLDGEDFGATASGTVSLDFDADLKGEVELSRRFSEDVASDVREARLLYNADGQVAVPFRYRGKVGEAKPQADVDRLATTVLGTKGAALVDELQKKLKGLFGR